ncbi:glycosyltransferase [Agrobacterium tumefaciens]|uniref:glycosyltransferase n=1 Tax=Agrobacterium tumefaciens TaxID=358 RepID=UPI0015729300|nr:glycosyltransferase [Agrobacterium tumefaciens]NSX92641.1 glycosyltransferase [Agrobacterium tumefaciens]NSX92702.1 glycosyltransferase [Agrobacterium tumefaciens]
MRISIIVPLRLGEALYEGEQRLEKLIENIPPDRFEVVVVDYGSPAAGAAALVAVVAKFEHAKLVRLDSETQPFSAGIARNLGAQNASSPVIMFNDVDCLASPEMYRRIHEEATARALDVNAYDFFSIPIAFLTFEGVEEYNKLQSQRPASVADSQFHYHIIRGEKQFVWFMAYSGSTIVVNRLHYLSIGGTSTEFHGHGAEDFEVKLRLAGHRPIGTKPLDFYHNTKTNQMQDFVGFRSYISLYGYEIAFRGIYMVHLWHPKREVKSVNVTANNISYKQTERNFGLLRRMMMAFDKSGTQPPALQDTRLARKTLVLCRPNSMSSENLRQALPLLGRYIITDETVFQDATALIETVNREGFTHILFLNPYGNPHRLELYKAVRDAGIPYWAFDRGALPHSWFFDPNGFNADSSSYAQENWNNPLSDQEREEIVSYIRSLKTNAETLEVNGPPRSQEYWRNILGVGARKVLFVPLQRPSDTVTNYFYGEVGPYENFYRWVSEVASLLDPSEWMVVVKKHPAEMVRPHIEGVTFAPDDAHVHDMLEMCDTVLLLNSGVGVLSLAFGKPVVACGDAFYAHPGLATTASTPKEAAQLIKLGAPYDREASYRFIHFLTQRFYSFGETAYVERNNGLSNFLAAASIKFSSIRMLTDTPTLFGNLPAQANVDSLLYSSYGGKDTMVRARAALPKYADKSASKTTSVNEKASVAKPVALTITPANVNEKKSLRRVIFTPVVRPVVGIIGTKKDDVARYNADPSGYFAKLKNPVYRGIGKVLFGTPK